ncbi:hypothetical protein D9M69_698030 [compost metagenome]
MQRQQGIQRRRNISWVSRGGGFQPLPGAQCGLPVAQQQHFALAGKIVADHPRTEAAGFGHGTNRHRFQAFAGNDAGDYLGD